MPGKLPGITEKVLCLSEILAYCRLPKRADASGSCTNALDSCETPGTMAPNREQFCLLQMPECLPKGQDSFLNALPVRFHTNSVPCNFGQIQNRTLHVALIHCATLHSGFCLPRFSMSDFPIVVFDFSPGIVRNINPFLMYRSGANADRAFSTITNQVSYQTSFNYAQKTV